VIRHKVVNASGFSSSISVPGWEIQMELNEILSEVWKMYSIKTEDPFKA
jgi:hypothetical protein